MKRAIAGVLVVVAGLALAGCTGIREANCQDDEYPAWSINYPDTGGACVPNGQDPGPGYARFPEGHVPYWLDEWYNPMESPGPTSST